MGVDPLKETYRTFRPYMGHSLGIVPETTSHCVVEPILNPCRMRTYYEDKNFFEKTLPEGFCPKALLRKVQGNYYDAGYRFLERNEGSIEKSIAAIPNQKLIVKPSIDSCSGRGVELFCKDGDGVFRHVKTGAVLTYAWLEDNAGKDFIVQEDVEQSPFMANLCATSANTLRMAVYRSVKDDSCHLLATVLRIGSDGSYVDNAHAGGRYVGVDADGTLGRTTYDQYGTSQPVFNGIDFSKETFIVPGYDKIKEFAIAVAQHIPHHRLLALDVVIRSDGTPVLLEYNIGGYSMWLFQFTGVSAFGDYAAEIHDYCLEHLDEAVMQVTI